LQALQLSWPPLEPLPAWQASLALLLVRRVSAQVFEPQQAASQALLPAWRPVAALVLPALALV